MAMRRSTRQRIQLVHDFLVQNGPITVDNIQQAAGMIGLPSDYLTRTLAIVRDDRWIDDKGWTIPFVAKGIGPKVYSVEETAGATQLLRNGNQRKSDEVETHLRRSLAGLKLEARLATPGVDKQKAQILATTTKAALDLIDLIP